MDAPMMLQRLPMKSEVKAPIAHPTIDAPASTSV
jgi:hypothetical protein